jgi:hypothetical protein
LTSPNVNDPEMDNRLTNLPLRDCSSLSLLSIVSFLLPSPFHFSCSPPLLEPRYLSPQMVRHASTTAEPTTTTTTTTTNAGVANAKMPMHKDKDIDGASPLASSAVDAIEADRSACRPEHVFHAFDALYCALTNATPVKPLFPDDK